MNNVGNGMASAILSSPPYNFTPDHVGLSYISPIVVCIPSTVLAGWAGDRLTILMARRNKGISEPEHKLLLLIPLTILVPGGLLMMGLGAWFQAHWIVYVIGQGIVMGIGPVGALIPLNYLFDAFHSIKPAKVDGKSSYDAEQQSAPYLVAMLILSSLITFGVVSVLFRYCFLVRGKYEVC